MTLEHKYDLWERIARLVYEEAIRTSRASRKQMKRLKFYVDALREYDAAKTAWEERTEDSETKEGFIKAGVTLSRARQELKH